MKIIEKERARALRKQGKSMNQIITETGFSKASVSAWVRDVVLTKMQRQKISERGRSVESIERRRINRITNENKRRRIIMDEAKKDFKNITQPELKLIGIILYLGEGSKTRG